MQVRVTSTGFSFVLRLKTEDDISARWLRVSRHCVCRHSWSYRHCNHCIYMYCKTTTDADQTRCQEEVRTCNANINKAKRLENKVGRPGIRTHNPWIDIPSKGFGSSSNRINLWNFLGLITGWVSRLQLHHSYLVLRNTEIFISVFYQFCIKCMHFLIRVLAIYLHILLNMNGWMFNLHNMIFCNYP